MDKPIYIHYGSKHFDPTIAQRARNQPIPWNKPQGDTGLWASRVDSSYGWKTWCEDEDFRKCSEENSFIFSLKDGANVVMVNKPEDLGKIPLQKSPYILSDTCIDFEECLREGIDAIELAWYGDEWADVKSGDMYMKLYGWDCDCILILDPDIVEEITEKEN